MENNEQINERRTKILNGLVVAHKKLIEMKRKNGSALVISENGRIVKIKPKGNNI